MRPAFGTRDSLPNNAILAVLHVDFSVLATDVHLSVRQYFLIELLLVTCFALKQGASTEAIGVSRSKGSITMSERSYLVASAVVKVSPSMPVA